MNYTSSTKIRQWTSIVLSLLLALTLNSINYPEWVQFARPDWVTLVLFYWCLRLPSSIGVGSGWLVGLMLDLMNYTVFGQHALGKAFIAMVAVSVSPRWKNYHLWKQCLIIFVVSSVDILIVISVHSITNNVVFHFEYWWAAVTTTLLWPLVYLNTVKDRTLVN